MSFFFLHLFFLPRNGEIGEDAAPLFLSMSFPSHLEKEEKGHPFFFPLPLLEVLRGNPFSFL